jgi:DNA-binding LacI/PurR family transcriptional regulator
MARKPQEINIAVIAAKANVSPSTVSRVINCRAGIGEHTRRRVTELLREHGFKPNYPAVKTTKVAVVYPWMALTDYFRKAMEGVYAYAMDKQLMINIIIAHENRRETLLEALREQQCSGVIAMLPSHYPGELDEVADTELPIISLDHDTGNPKIGFIDNDSYIGSCLGTQHLIDLGHRKIAYITYDKMAPNQIQRFNGFTDTLKKNKIPVIDDYIFKFKLRHATLVDAPKDPVIPARRPTSYTSKMRGREGYISMKLMLQKRHDFTAVMTTDDCMALGVISAIHEAGLMIPEDISVVGFDNYAETVFWTPPLTTINHSIETAGYMAIKSMHEAIKKPEDWIPPREVLPTSLVIRKSTSSRK